MGEKSCELTDIRDCEQAIIDGIIEERYRQQTKWGRQTHSIAEWLMILGEEYGEACKAGNEHNFGHESFEGLKKELIQTAAVSLAILEGIAHKEWVEKGLLWNRDKPHKDSE